MVIELKALEAIEDLIDLIKQDAAPASQDKWYYVRNHPAPPGVTPVQGPRKAWRWNPAMARAAGLDDDAIDQHLKTEVVEIEEDSAEEEKEFEETLREGEIGATATEKPKKHWAEDLPESTREAISEFLPDELIPGRTPFNPLPWSEQTEKPKQADEVMRGRKSLRSLLFTHPKSRMVLSTLAQQGKPYVVGGGVRDALLGRPSKDVDIEVHGIEVDDLAEIVERDLGGKKEQVGKQFGVFVVDDFDIALPRTETKTGAKHTDFDVKPDPNLPLEHAARRRDFTINALMYDPVSDEILDFFGGQDDIKSKNIKHVDPKTFVEDPLRVYRAAQFAARFDFSIDPSTQKLARSMDLSDLPKERVFGEVQKMLLRSPKPSVGIQALDDMDVLDRYLPEVSDLKETGQRDDFHAEGDVFIHTKMALDEAAKVIKRFPDEKDKTIIMLATLCHDLGKPATTNKETGQAIGHEDAGVDVSKKLLSRLTNDKEIVDTVLSLVENHLKPGQFHRNKASDAAFRRLINKHGTKFLDLLSGVAEADTRGRLHKSDDGTISEPDSEEVDWFREKVKEVSESAGVKEGKIVPLISGNALKDLGFKEGRELGDILRDIKSKQEDGTLTTATEALKYVRDVYKSLRRSEDLLSLKGLIEGYDPQTLLGDLLIKQGVVKQNETPSSDKGTPTPDSGRGADWDYTSSNTTQPENATVNVTARGKRWWQRLGRAAEKPQAKSPQEQSQQRENERLARAKSPQEQSQQRENERLARQAEEKEVVTQGKEPWEMTRDEWGDAVKYGTEKVKIDLGEKTARHFIENPAREVSDLRYMINMGIGQKTGKYSGGEYVGGPGGRVYKVLDPPTERDPVQAVPELRYRVDPTTNELVVTKKDIAPDDIINTPLFHRTKNADLSLTDLTPQQPKSSIFAGNNYRGIFFSPDPVDMIYGENVIEASIDPSAKIVNITDIPSSKFANQTDAALEHGIDVVYRESWDGFGEPIEIIVLNPKVIRRGSHEKSVRKAITEGKSVPEEVLRDYPDLAKSPAQEAASSAKETDQPKSSMSFGSHSVDPYHGKTGLEAKKLIENIEKEGLKISKAQRSQLSDVLDRPSGIFSTPLNATRIGMTPSPMVDSLLQFEPEWNDETSQWERKPTKQVHKGKEDEYVLVDATALGPLVFMVYGAEAQENTYVYDSLATEDALDAVHAMHFVFKDTGKHPTKEQEKELRAKGDYPPARSAPNNPLRDETDEEGKDRLDRYKAFYNDKHRGTLDNLPDTSVSANGGHEALTTVDVPPDNLIFGRDLIDAMKDVTLTRDEIDKLGKEVGYDRDISERFSDTFDDVPDSYVTLASLKSALTTIAEKRKADGIVFKADDGEKLEFGMYMPNYAAMQEGKIQMIRQKSKQINKNQESNSSSNLEKADEALSLVTFIENLIKKSESASIFSKFLFLKEEWYYVRNHPAPPGVTPQQGPRKAWRWSASMARKAGLNDQQISEHLDTSRDASSKASSDVRVTAQADVEQEVDITASDVNVEDFVSWKEWSRGFKKVSPDELKLLVRQQEIVGMGNGKPGETKFPFGIIRVNKEGKVTGVTSADGQLVNVVETADKDGRITRANVRFSTVPESHVQFTYERQSAGLASGKGKGETEVVRSYSFAHKVSSAGQKFELAKAVASKMSALRKAVKKDLTSSKRVVRETAFAVAMLDHTAKRVDADEGTSKITTTTVDKSATAKKIKEFKKKGGTKNGTGRWSWTQDSKGRIFRVISGEKKDQTAYVQKRVRTYGISSIRPEHITELKNGSVQLRFLGKDGKVNKNIITDPFLKKELLDRKKAPPGKNGELINTSYSSIAKYMKDSTGLKDISPHDFRYFHATRLAGEAMKKLGSPKKISPDDFRKELMKMNADMVKLRGKGLSQDEKIAASATICKRLHEENLIATVGKYVAPYLAHEPTQSIKTYISPFAFEESGWAAIMSRQTYDLGAAASKMKLGTSKKKKAKKQAKKK